jgi:tetratricopeptide (TPR) repeat protein
VPVSLKPAPSPMAPDPPRTPLRQDWFLGLLLLAATLAAYCSTWHAGFVWDDDGHLTRPDLRSLHGLGRIWFEAGATQQYYPLLHSAFWVEWRLWGGHPLGYHLANVILHSGAAFLLYRILRRLAVPGAYLGALLFAVHPVCVESVAWVSEQKNTLSAVFYMAAALAYLRFDRERRARWYALAAGLFLLALASKTVTCTLPGALLVALWWSRGRIGWKRDLLPLLPLFALGAAGGLVTAWMERTYIGTGNVDFKIGLVDRFLIAGRVPWFYLGKLLWPVDLTFIYPHWDVSARAGWQYLYPAATLAALAGLYALRRSSRGPLAAALLFLGTLFPALGFFNVYPFVYSYVADHFQYLAAAMVLSAVAAAFAVAVERLTPRARAAARAGAGAVVLLLAVMTSLQSANYADADTLWRATLARNPACWMAYDNLGASLLKQGRLDDAIAQYHHSLAVAPDDVIALNLLGVALLTQGHADQAVAQFRTALAINPGFAETHNNMAVALLQKGDVDGAIDQYTRALEINRQSTPTEINLGSAYLYQGKVPEALAHFQRALDLDPENNAARDGHANALRQNGQLDAAIAEYRRTLESAPADLEANNDLGVALLEKKDVADAVACFQRALQTNPHSAQAHVNLAGIELGRNQVDAAITDYREALAAEPKNARAHNNLGYALLLQGQLDEAAAQFRLALEINPNYADAKKNLGVARARREERDHTGGQ